MLKDLVEIKGDPFIIDMMYARKNNMTGRAVYEEIGLGNRAFVHVELAEKLAILIPQLQQAKLKMKICDAYRPPLAHQIMKEIIPLPGFFASSPERSQHCHATAIDVCLTTLEGEELPYPTLVDAYDAVLAEEVRCGKPENFLEHLQKARQDYESKLPEMAPKIANRKQLKEMMEQIGMESISSEWWHFDLPNGRSAKYPMIEF